MSPLQPLADLAARGLQPIGRLTWMGIGYKPPKRCGFVIDPTHLPTDADCRAVAGLDVIVCYHGNTTRYGVLRGLCGALYQAQPRRLQVIDMDAKRVAFLKLGGG